MADVRTRYLEGCRAICNLHTKDAQLSFATKLIDMATSWLPLEDRGLLWTGMYSPPLQQAMQEASVTLKQNQWERILYTISSQLAEATREIWRLYNTRLRELDPAADLMLPTKDPDWRADTASSPPDDSMEDSLDPVNGLKRDRAGDALHTAGESHSSNSISSSSDPVYMLSACTCVNSRSVRRLVSDELLLTAMCHCASRYAGDYG